MERLSIDHKVDVALVKFGSSFIDGSNVRFFKSRMAPVIQANPKVVIDLSEVDFIDSTGITAMLWCQRQLAEKGGEMKLSGIAPRVRMILELLRLEQIFSIHSTAEEASKEFDKAANPTLRHA